MKSLFAAFALIALVASSATAETPEIITRSNTNVLDKTVRVHAPGKTIPELRALQAKFRTQAAVAPAAPVSQTNNGTNVASAQ